MPIIKRRPKEILRPVSFRLPESLIEKLNAYADYVNVPTPEIVAAAVRHAIEMDQEFVSSLYTNPLQNVIQNAIRKPHKTTDKTVAGGSVAAQPNSITKGHPLQVNGGQHTGSVSVS